nr:MAG TPA: hypothetical protein [Caudoviricetes sp.]
MQFKSNFLCCCDSCPHSRNKGSNAVLHKQSPSGAFEALLIIPRWDRWNQFGGELYHG